MAPMDLTPYVDTLRRELAVAAEAGGEDARELAERLTAPLESATRLTMLNVLSAAMDEITRELAPGSVDVRLRGLDPDFVVTPPLDRAPPRQPPRPSKRPFPGPRRTKAAPPASTCVCRPTSRPAPRRPRPARACRSTRGWCAPCRPRSDGGTRPRTAEKTQTIGQSFTGWVRCRAPAGTTSPTPRPTSGDALKTQEDGTAMPLSTLPNPSRPRPMWRPVPSSSSRATASTPSSR